MSASVAIAFHGLTAAEDLESGEAEAPSVSPALPTILRALADRDIDATFYLGDEVREREPLAATMIRNGRHTVGSPADEPEAAVRDAPYLLDQGQEGGPAGANALHQALQLAVADALRGQKDVVLTFTPGLLERVDALAVFVETLELVEGLRAAGSLRTV
ncbi:MAG TPA: hypothetical protein VEX39_10060 [Thermoleophilaceae bacterium]|nr:hypothetical protein [Thermoleophilaceae bacterium]